MLIGTLRALATATQLPQALVNGNLIGGADPVGERLERRKAA